MNYPLISEYIEAIKSAEDNFEELSYLRPVLGDDGLPLMTSGNFAVVFKMKDEQSGKFYAVKCFTKEQEGRAEAYREIAKELENVSSPYILSIRYLDKELYVDTDQTTETEFPVLLMDWVEGKTLDNYLRENLDDKYALEMLAYRFSQLAQWLIPQPFAHGDLKPDNILVHEDGTLVLVDYDGMYVPAMKGQKARELGSPDFCHPLRTENDFDERIDDFPTVSIMLSLELLKENQHYLNQYGSDGRLLFSKDDYLDIHNCTLFVISKNSDSKIIQNLSFQISKSLKNHLYYIDFVQILELKKIPITKYPENSRSKSFGNLIVVIILATIFWSFCSLFLTTYIIFAIILTLFALQSFVCVFFLLLKACWQLIRWNVIWGDYKSEIKIHGTILVLWLICVLVIIIKAVLI